jgi:hypothetical protein
MMPLNRAYWRGDADAGVEHYRRQKPRLPRGEALLGNRLDAFIEVH